MQNHILAVLLTLSIAVAAFPGRTDTITPGRAAAGDITLDGKLDEPAWQQAQLSSPFVSLKTTEGKEGPAKTQFRLLTEPQALVFGVRCDEPMMDKLSDAPLPHDGPVWERDCVEIFFDPTGKGFDYYQLMIGAGNTRFDAYYIEGGNTNQPYNSIYESAIFKGADFWSVEVRIPLSALDYTTSDQFADAWLMNVARERHPVMELTTWTPLRRGFHEIQNFSRVGSLPKKDPRFDLRLASVSAFPTKVGDAYPTSLEFSVTATKNSAGSYTLSVSDAEGGGLGEKKVTVAPGDSVVSIDNISFAALGKTALQASLLSDQRERIAGAWFYPRLEYVPLRVDVREPFYAHCIFHDRNLKRIAGTVEVNLPADQLRGAQLRVSLKAGEEVVASSSPKLLNRKADFTFDASKLSVGDYLLVTEVVTGGKALAKQVDTIRKLGSLQAGTSVRIDENLNLIVDGKPMYVRSWYGGEGYTVSQQLLKSSPHPNSQWVNAFNCYVGVEAERIDAGERDRIKTDVMPSDKVFDGMRKTIEAQKSNPKLLWWYLADEPECRGLSSVYLKHQYSFIKKLDPYHPVMIISRSPEEYTQCADILNPHPYLNPTIDSQGNRSMRSPRQISKQMQTVLSAGKGRIPAWCTPQAFSYGFADPSARCPNFTEYRCMVYAAVVNGAKGFTPFAYFGHFETMELRTAVDFVYGELADLEGFLLNTEKTSPVKVVSAEDGVEACVRKLNGKPVLIAVNLLDKPVRAQITSADLKGLKLSGYREPASIVVARDGSVALDFSPSQVRVFTSEKIDAVKKSIAQVLKEIDEVNASLKKPGNILFDRGREIEWDASDTYIASKSLFTLCDGVTDQFGWKDVFARAPARIEAAFPNFVPKFSKAKIYSATVEDLEFWIWKAGDWQKVGEVKGNQDDVIALDFGKTLSTVKIKLLMPQVHPKMRAEVYEIELYE